MVAAIDHKKINIATGEFKKGTWSIGCAAGWIGPCLFPTGQGELFSLGGTIGIVGAKIMIVPDRIDGNLL